MNKDNRLPRSAKRRPKIRPLHSAERASDSPELELAATEALSGKREKVALLVARAIVAEIVQQDLKPGTILPSEARMLAKYRVGRNSFREALRLLELNGLIYSRTGRYGGQVVRAVRTEDFGLTAALHLFAHKARISELVQARLMLEPVMAGLTAERKDPKVRRQLESALEHARLRQHQGGHGYHSATQDFHRIIAEICGNKVLYLYANSLRHILEERLHALVFPPSMRDKVLNDHAAIAEAIIKHDRKKAEALMREHMEEFATWVKKRFPGLEKELVSWP